MHLFQVLSQLTSVHKLYVNFTLLEATSTPVLFKYHKIIGKNEWEVQIQNSLMELEEKWLQQGYQEGIWINHLPALTL
jgi:hypothetical protein